MVMVNYREIINKSKHIIMDQKIASTSEQQQSQPQKTIEFKVVGVENKSQSLASGALIHSASRGSINQLRTIKKGPSRLHNYSINTNSNLHPQQTTSRGENMELSNFSASSKRKLEGPQRLNDQKGSVIWQHNDHLHKKSVENTVKGDQRSSCVTKQKSQKRLPDVSPSAKYQHVREQNQTPIITEATSQNNPHSYQSSNSRHLSHNSQNRVKPQQQHSQVQSLQQITGMKMMSAKQSNHQARLFLDQNQPRKQSGDQITYAKAHTNQVIRMQDKRSSHSQTHGKYHQHNLGSKLNIQKPLNINQPVLNQNGVQQHKAQQSFVPPNSNATTLQKIAVGDPKSQNETKKDYEELRELSNIKIGKSVLQKAGQVQIKYGSRTSIEGVSSASVLSQSQTSGKKNVRKRQLQEQVMTSQTITASSKLVKATPTGIVGSSKGSNSVRSNKSKPEYGLHEKQKASVDGIAERNSFPTQQSINSIFTDQKEQMKQKESQSSQPVKDVAIKEKIQRTPSQQNLQNKLKNRKSSRSNIIQLPVQNNQQCFATPAPVSLGGKTRPQSNTIDHYYAHGNAGNAPTSANQQQNSSSAQTQPSQATLHSKIKQANLKQRQSKGGLPTQSHSIRHDSSNHASNQAAGSQNGTLHQATLNTQNSKQAARTEGDAPVYKNKAPKFVPAEKYKIKLGPCKVEEQNTKDRGSYNYHVKSARRKISLKHAKDGNIHARNSYRVKNHVLSSDSSSSDAYMYEEEIEGETTKRSPSPKKNVVEVDIKQQSASEEEVYNEVDVGEGHFEGEDWEEEMDGDLDYEDDGENDDQQQDEEEGLSNAGEEGEEESTKLNTQEQKSDAESRKLKKQNGTQSIGELQALKKDKVTLEKQTEVKDDKQTSPKKDGQLVRKKVPRLIMNLIYTFYPVIKKVSKQLNFRCKCEDIQLLPPPPGSDDYYRQMNGYQPVNPPDFDVSWFDNPIPAETLAKLKPYQRISQFPGIAVVSNKNKLARNLMKMRKEFPDAYDFFPQTFVLPVEYNEFKAQFEKYARAMQGTYNMQPKSDYKALQNQTFIIKPENLCQGKGIFLVRDPLDVDPGDKMVAQKYISNPLLIDDLKFDLRIYVLLFGINPLRIFLFRDGLVRFATEPYNKPNDSNIDNLYMHLTNYAINKNSDNFVQNDGGDGTDEEDDDGTHKRSLKSLWSTLRIMGFDVKKLKAQIKEIVIKTLITAQPSICHLVRSCQPDDIENQLCFQILGFDVMIDEKFKPWLIEVNQSPSFKTESGLDKRIKQKLVADTLRLLNLSHRRKTKILNHMKAEMKKRMLTGKKTKLTPEEKAQKIKEIDEQRNRFELANLGDFKLIYPTEQADKQVEYEKFLEVSAEIWEDFTTGRRRKIYQTQSNWNDGKDEEPGAFTYRQQMDMNGKPIWKASGVVKNYVPAWEKSFKKSMIAKQQRLEQAKYQNITNNMTPIPSSDKQPMTRQDPVSPKPIEKLEIRNNGR